MRALLYISVAEVRILVRNSTPKAAPAFPYVNVSYAQAAGKVMQMLHSGIAKLDLFASAAWPYIPVKTDTHRRTPSRTWM